MWFLSASKASHGNSVSHVFWYFLTRLLSNFVPVPRFSVEISSTFCSLPPLSSSLSLPPSVSSSFRFFRENPNWNRLIMTFQHTSASSAAYIWPRGTGQNFEIHQHSLRVTVNMAMHSGSQSCSFGCILFKLCIFFQSTGMKYPELRQRASCLNFLLDRNKTSGCPIRQVLPEFYLPIESFYLPRASGQALVSNTGFI